MGTCRSSVNGIKVSEEDKTLTFADGTVASRATLFRSTAPPATYIWALSQRRKPSSPAISAASWAGLTRFCTLHVRTNGDTPRDATCSACKFGAEGIGLCRTEHMFFEPARIKAVREMIISDTLEQRKAALAKILPMQRGD